MHPSLLVIIEKHIVGHVDVSTFPHLFTGSLSFITTRLLLPASCQAPRILSCSVRCGLSELCALSELSHDFKEWRYCFVWGKNSFLNGIPRIVFNTKLASRLLRTRANAGNASYTSNPTREKHTIYKPFVIKPVVSNCLCLQVTVNALFAAIPGIANVLLVCLVFWLIFSILGVQLFAGKFYKCVDSNGNRLLASAVPDKITCLSYNGTYAWQNSNVNFDNVLKGFLALFQVVGTLDKLELCVLELLQFF